MTKTTFENPGDLIGKEVTVTVVRGGQLLEVTAVIGEQA